MPAWDDSWSVAGISVPLPPERSEELETVEVARWQRTFCSGVDTAQAGRAWDAWAAEQQLRTVDSGGPTRSA